MSSPPLDLEPIWRALDATGLVHEAYLRLGGDQPFDNTGHFFAAAAEAMRRILIESARKKARRQRSADLHRTALAGKADAAPVDDLLAVDEALTKLAAEDAQAAALVKLCYYAGLSVEDAGTALGLSRATAYREWTYAKAWLASALSWPDA